MGRRELPRRPRHRGPRLNRAAAGAGRVERRRVDAAAGVHPRDRRRARSTGTPAAVAMRVSASKPSSAFSRTPLRCRHRAVAHPRVPVGSDARERIQASLGAPCVSARSLPPSGPIRRTRSRGERGFDPPQNRPPSAPITVGKQAGLRISVDRCASAATRQGVGPVCDRPRRARVGRGIRDVWLRSGAVVDRRRPVGDWIYAAICGSPFRARARRSDARERIEARPRRSHERRYPAIAPPRPAPRLSSG